MLSDSATRQSSFNKTCKRGLEAPRYRHRHLDQVLVREEEFPSLLMSYICWNISKYWILFDEKANWLLQLLYFNWKMEPSSYIFYRKFLMEWVEFFYHVEGKSFIVAISDEYFWRFNFKISDNKWLYFSRRYLFLWIAEVHFWEFHRNILFHKRAPNPSIIQPSSRRSHRFIKWEIDGNYCFDFSDIQ